MCDDDVVVKFLTENYGAILLELFLFLNLLFIIG